MDFMPQQQSNSSQSQHPSISSSSASTYSSNAPSTVSTSLSPSLTPAPPSYTELPKVDQKTFENSLSEVYQFKQCISLKIKQLEQAIGRLKSLVLVYGDQEELPQSAASTTGNSAMAADQQQSKPPKARQTNGGIALNHSSQSSSSCGSPSQADLLELRTILTDIDLHLAVLKDVEERHAHICESYSQEIRARDETLHTKAHQILTLSQELALQQAKINQLMFQNKKLESEINLVRNQTPHLSGKQSVDSGKASSGTASPKLPHPLDHTLAGHYLIDLEAKQLSPPLINLSAPPKEEKKPEAPMSSPNSVIAGRNYEQMYYKLLQQYHKGDHLPTKPDEFKLNDSLGAAMSKQQATISAESRGIIDIEEGLHQHASITFEKPVEPPIKPSRSAIDELDEDQDTDDETKPLFRDVEKQQTTIPTKMSKKVTIDKSAPKVSRFTEQQFAEQANELNSIKEEEIEDEVTIDQEEKEALLANFEKSKNFLKEHKIADKVISLEILTGEGEEAGMSQTPKSVYDHFLQMQKDLEKLVRSEKRFRVRCQELELELAHIREAKEDDEYKLSEATYELDILKHNYDLEMESFGSAVTERESLIEKLQQKVEALKRKYMTLDERLQASVNKEVGYKSQIEEAEGRVRYEQLQRQAVIDARVNELELKLAAADSEHQEKTRELQQELAQKLAKEKELNGRIEELEETLKNLVISNSTNGSMINGDNLVVVEDEFAYYKNRIDSLLKEVENEQQNRQAVADKYEDELKAKDKMADQLREQLRKDKDIFLREKNDFDTKFRKLATKFKVKEREITSLQEKLMAISEKFKPRTETNGELGSMDPIEPEFKSAEQLMTELALHEASLSELRTKLENAEEHLLTLNGTLQKERDRRRELESHYLAQMKGRGKSRGFFWGAIEAITGSSADQANQQDEWTTLEDTNQLYMMQPYSPSHLYPYHNGPHHRNSTASLSLLMEESGGFNHIYGGHHAADMLGEGQLSDNPTCSDTFFESISRLVRRQKNAFLFGSRKEKTVRITILIYLILVHFYAFEYYVG